MKAIVVIPVWRSAITHDEVISLKRCICILGKHPIALLTPEGLSIDRLPLSGAADLTIERFEQRFFTGIGGYNRLMLSDALYSRFTSFDYMLVYQLDALVFEDQLDEWCSKGYDYVGAPWVGDQWPPPSMRPFKRALLRAALQPGVRVGNGGFSLRKVQSFIRARRLLNPLAALWRSNEDLFWSVAARRLAGFRIPAVSEAMSFSFELEPRRCYEELGHRLPFGCHAWARYDPKFWQAVLPTADCPPLS